MNITQNHQKLNPSNADDLKILIEQTYILENKWKNLKQSYDFLTDTLAQIIEVLPTAIWILDSDKNIFLQNKLASQNKTLFKNIDFSKDYYEAQVKQSFYQVKIISHIDKTIISATDITNEKRNERLASMGQISAHLAHEIRNPIGSISLLLGTLLGRVDTKNKALVIGMQDALRRVERIIKHTLLFTKGITLNKKDFSLKELEKECQDIFEKYTQSDIDFCIDFQNITLNADKELLLLVLQNLIYNAVDAIEEALEEDIITSGNITLKAHSNGKKTQIQIQDNGTAIKNINLFEAYKTTKLKGNGLGLSLSKEIITAHKGTIKAIKNPKSFLITLP